MATVMELIGLSPMGTAAVPQVDKRKDDVAYRCGEIIMDAVRKNILPRDICTRKAFDNAIAGVAGTAGSTNAVLHLLAMAREAEVPLTIDDFEPVLARTPVFVDIKPGGNYMAADVDKAGGIPVIAQAPGGRRLRGWLGAHRHRPHLRGRSRRRAGDAGQEVIRPLDKALKPRGGIAILRGIAGARRLRDQAGRATIRRSTTVRRACSSAKKTPWRRCRKARSRRTTWW